MGRYAFISLRDAYQYTLQAILFHSLTHSAGGVLVYFTCCSIVIRLGAPYGQRQSIPPTPTAWQWTYPGVRSSSNLHIHSFWCSSRFIFQGMECRTSVGLLCWIAYQQILPGVCLLSRWCTLSVICHCKLCAEVQVSLCASSSVCHALGSTSCLCLFACRVVS